MREWDGQDGGRTERKSKETDIFFEQAIMVLARNLALGKFPGIQRMTQAKVLSNSGVERVPKLAFPCNQTDDYLNCHHRTFIQQLIHRSTMEHCAEFPKSSQREGGAII